MTKEEAQGQQGGENMGTEEREIEMLLTTTKTSARRFQ